ncbi:Glycosyl transferase family 21, partial [Rhizoctonia solani]
MSSDYDMSEGEGSGSDDQYTSDDDVMIDSQADVPEEELSDGDDGGFAMDESVILKGKSKSYEVDHKSLSVEDLERQMEKDAEQFTSIFGIDLPTALMILRYMSWNKEQAMEKFMEDQQLMLRKAGIALPGDSVPKKPRSKSEPFMCPVCCDDEPAEVLSLDCGHEFCSECWTQYLEGKIRGEGEVQLACMAEKCKVLVPDAFVFDRVSPVTKERFREGLVRQYVASIPKLRFCPHPSCVYTVQCSAAASRAALDTIVPTVKCGEEHSFCFGCEREGDHRPLICKIAKLWLKKCQDDSETANWIKSNTKECTKCQSTIEKNGGCNHMTCKKCKAEFCWVCMGPWSEHGNAWYTCNRYDEKESVEARDSQSKSRASLERYLFYYNRYANHEQSARLSLDLYAKTERKMEEMQITSDLTWIEVQFAKKAVDEVVKCRNTLQWTVSLTISRLGQEKGNQKELFEDNQRDLEKAVEELSELLEQPIEAKDIAALRQKITDKAVYVLKRNDIVLEDTAKALEARTCRLAMAVKTGTRTPEHRGTSIALSTSISSLAADRHSFYSPSPGLIVVSSPVCPEPTMLYLTADRFAVFVPFGVIGFYRYLWYLIRVAASFTYRPIPVPENPTYIASEDVTIIVPTIDAGEEFKEAAHSWLVGKPKEILIITEERMLGPLQELADSVDPSRIRVLTVPFANKRLQMTHGIRNTTTDIIVFADDDAIWPPTMLPMMLACFEDQKVGGVGTSQRVQPVGKNMTVWETLAAFRLTIRNIEISSATHIDGGVPCLSGRTAAYRTVILKDPEFLHGFTHDFWLGKYQLNSGDDKFLTRWMVSHGWNTYIQCCKEAELLSTMKPNWRFLLQVLRWTRNTWRSDLRSLFMERHVWTSHPYCAYTMVDKLFNPFTLLVGPVLVIRLCIQSTKPVAQGGYHLPWWNILASYAVWLSATRTAKLLPHLWHRPQDIIYVPAFIAFGYYFAIMKLYALFTLHEVGWGTRAGIGNATDATKALEAQNAQEAAAAGGPDREKLMSHNDRGYDAEAGAYQQGYSR